MAKANPNPLPSRRVAAPTPPKVQPTVAPAPTKAADDEADLQAIGRNVHYVVEGDTLIMYINVSETALRNAPGSKCPPGKNPATHVSNPVIASSKGFQYIEGVYPDKVLGISLNIIAKDPN